jgi:hypothetical protein
MNIVALKDTTWSISPSQNTGILFFGILPLEEVVFFFITNILIAFGMTLLLANESQSRLAEFIQRFLRKEQESNTKQAHLTEFPDRVKSTHRGDGGIGRRSGLKNRWA